MKNALVSAGITALFLAGVQSIHAAESAVSLPQALPASELAAKDHGEDGGDAGDHGLERHLPDDVGSGAVRREHDQPGVMAQPAARQHPVGKA